MKKNVPGSKISFMNRETIELINTRRSCRAFRQEAVDGETVRELKRLTMRAPSAGNMLLYSVIEVTDPAKKAELAEICDSQMMIKNAPLVWVFLADNNKWEKFFTYSGSPEKFSKPMRETGLGDMHLCMQDAIIAAQNAVIAAEALGLGSCYIGDVIENYERLQKLLNLPAHAIPAAMLIMGYPLSEKREAVTPRPDPDSSVFMENGYADLTEEAIFSQYEHHRANYENKKLLPLDNTGSVADYYYNRKYTSDFMDEMNRSAKVFITRWLNEQ